MEHWNRSTALRVALNLGRHHLSRLYLRSMLWRTTPLASMSIGFIDLSRPEIPRRTGCSDVHRHRIHADAESWVQEPLSFRVRLELLVRLTYASGVSLSLGRETTCLAESYHAGERESWTMSMGASTQYTKRRDESLDPPKPGDPWPPYIPVWAPSGDS